MRQSERVSLHESARIIERVTNPQPVAPEDPVIVTGIKQMPEYDPDAEINGLLLTVPTWIMSMERLIDGTDFHQASEEARNKLVTTLRELESATSRLRNRAMIAMMFDTGVRLSELMELVETQIHEESIMIYGKGAKERVVPVSPFLSKALLRYTRARESFFRNSLHDKEFFLSCTGKKLTAEAVAKMLKKAAKAVGVSEDVRVSPHTCRHTFAHLNLKNGIDLYTLNAFWQTSFPLRQLRM